MLDAPVSGGEIGAKGASLSIMVGGDEAAFNRVRPMLACMGNPERIIYIGESGAGFSGASAVHMNIFGLNPVVVFGSEEQKRRMLPPLIHGKERACFAVTEPNTGLNTRKLKTKAEKRGGTA